MTYQYEQLEDLETDIRVAVLQPAVAYNEEIRVSFRTRRLSVGKFPLLSRKSFQYEALSYVWGSTENPSHACIVNKKADQGSLSITRNLDAALRHLREKSRPRLIWIDALCINQSDHVEKSRQVAMISNIFPAATCVIAWLGPEENNSRHALYLMKQWARQVVVDWDEKAMYPSKSNSELSWPDESVPLPYIAGELDSVKNLLGRPYFERIWVRPEYILATLVVVQYGDLQMPWEEFRAAIGCLMWKSIHPSAFTVVQENDRSAFRKAIESAFDVCRMDRGGYRYSNIRIHLREAKCLDHRDRIYAISNLLSSEDQQLDVKPDYTRTTKALYVDVAQRIFNIYRKLNLLETCELSSRVLNIPSWVPDWSSRLHVSHAVRSTWSACAWISAQVEIVAEDKVRVAGVEAARVGWMSGTLVSEYVRKRSDFLQMLKKLQPSVRALADRSKSFSNSVEQHCRALLCDDFSHTYLPPRCDRPDFEECKEALEVVWSSENANAPVELVELLYRKYWPKCSSMLVGRGFFSATNGYVGIAPADTQPGDLICVLLGCPLPVVLRPACESQTSPAWEVTGVCYAQGLMDGEAIYVDKLRNRYQSLHRMDRIMNSIDGSRSALYDRENQTIHTNPAEILLDMDIKVEEYQQRPHVLEVSPKTLRLTGAALQHFMLVYNPRIAFIGHHDCNILQLMSTNLHLAATLLSHLRRTGST